MVFLITFDGGEIIKRYEKPRIKVATFLIDNVKRVVPGCGCNIKRDRAFVRIQKFGEESGTLAGLVGGINFQIFCSSPTNRHTRNFLRESTCLSNVRKRCRDCEATRAFLT